MKAFAYTRSNAACPRSVVRPTCPQCKDILFAATVSVHVHDKEIRNWWSCETCGHQFLTTVALVDVPTEELILRVA